MGTGATTTGAGETGTPMPIETLTRAWAGTARLVIPTNVTTLNVCTSVLRRSMMLSSLCNVNALWRDKIKGSPPIKGESSLVSFRRSKSKRRAPARAC